MLDLDSGLNLGGACKESTLKNVVESNEEAEVLCQVFSKIEPFMSDACCSRGSKLIMESYEVRFVY